MRAANGFQFSIESNLRLRQLHVDGDAQPTRCDWLSAGPELPIGELLFFAEETNACVKALAVSTFASSCSHSSTTPTDCYTTSSESNNKPVPAFRSHKDGVPRAVGFARGADPQVLLVVEMLLNCEAKRERHFLLAIRRQKAADGDDECADSWRVEQRERLTTTPTAWDEEHFMQLHALPDGRVVCDMSKSKQLELFDPSALTNLTSPQPQATANDYQKTVAVARRPAAVLHVLFVRTRRRRRRRAFVRVGRRRLVRAPPAPLPSASGPPAAQRLRLIEASSRRNGCAPDGASGGLLCGLWDEWQYAHAMWRVSGVGQSTELVGNSLHGADDEGLDFACWCSLGNDRILLNHMHRAQLVIGSRKYL